MKTSPNPFSESTATYTLRNDFKPGDLEAIVTLHGTIYAREYGFDSTFEAYVAGPLAEFACARTNRDQLWVAEHGDRIVGCIAIVGTSEKVAQLRWFLVDLGARGLGLGKKLIHEAIAFCKNCGYESLFLWTVSTLTAAAHLYRSVGFEKVEDNPSMRWGVAVVEERYVLQV